MKFRYSAIETALRCQRRFQIEYLEKRTHGGVPAIELTFGTALHTALQASVEGDDAYQAFEVFWGPTKAADLKQKAELGYMAGEFIRKFEKMHRQHLEPVHLEKHMLGTINGIDFEGTCDFVGAYKGIPCILDYKTSAYNYMPSKILSNPQMPLYAELARQDFGFKAEKIVYMVFVKATQSIQVQEVDLTPGMLSRALETCSSLAHELQSKKGMMLRNPTACQMGRFRCPWFTECYGDV